MNKTRFRGCSNGRIFSHALDSTYVPQTKCSIVTMISLQVTQQTIRVPMGYPLPGMQLHVVAGRGNAIGAQQYAQYARHQGAQRNYAYLPAEKPAVKFTERGVPEGAASVTQSDANNGLMSPTSSNAQSSQNGMHITTQTSTTTQPGVFYAMNV